MKTTSDLSIREDDKSPKMQNNILGLLNPSICQYFTAIASISTKTSFGSLLTSTAALAGL